MVEWVSVEVDEASERAGLAVARADNYTLDSRVDDRAGAHRTGFERYIQLASVQPPATKPRTGGIDREQLGVRQRVLRGLAQIEALGYNLSIHNDDRSDRHLAASRGFSGERERPPHELFVSSNVLLH